MSNYLISQPIKTNSTHALVMSHVKLENPLCHDVLLTRVYWSDIITVDVIEEQINVISLHSNKVDNWGILAC